MVNYKFNRLASASAAVAAVAALLLDSSTTIMVATAQEDDEEGANALSYEATCKTTGPYGLGAPSAPVPVELVGEVACTGMAVPFSYWSSTQFNLVSNPNRGGNGDADGISTGATNFQMAPFPRFETFDIALHVECHVPSTSTVEGTSNNETTIVATNECWTTVTLEKEPAPVIPTCNATNASQDIVAPPTLPVTVDLTGSATCSDGSLPADSSMKWTILPGGPLEFHSAPSSHLSSDQIQLSETIRTDSGTVATAMATATLSDYGDYEVCFEVLCIDTVNGGLEYTDQCCSKIGVLRTPRMPPFCPAALPPNTIVGAAASTIVGAANGRAVRLLTSISAEVAADGSFVATSDSTTSSSAGGGLVSKHACDFAELAAGRPLNKQVRKLAKYYPYMARIEAYNTITNDTAKNPANINLQRGGANGGTKTLIIQDENSKVKQPKPSAYGGCLNITFAHQVKPVALRDFGLSGIPAGQVATITLVHVSGWETTLTSPDDDTTTDSSSSDEWIASSTYRAELSDLTAMNLQEMHICLPSTGAVTFIDVSVCDEDYNSVGNAAGVETTETGTTTGAGAGRN